jgi:hypothetical protein
MRQQLLLGVGMRATTEVLLEAVFPMWSFPRLYHATDRVQFSPVSAIEFSGISRLVSVLDS